MKNIIKSVLGALLLLTVTGCGTPGVSGGSPLMINSLLDRVLPPDFVGPVKVKHTNVYFDFTIEARGLRHDEKGWHWDYLTYVRHDRFSSGEVSFGLPPQ